MGGDGGIRENAGGKEWLSGKNKALMGGGNGGSRQFLRLRRREKGRNRGVGKERR